MKLILTLFTCLFVTGCAYAQNFSDYFTNKTLRIDYLFTGNADKQSICLDELSECRTGEADAIICRNCLWKETDRL